MKTSNQGWTRNTNGSLVHDAHPWAVWENALGTFSATREATHRYAFGRSLGPFVTEAQAVAACENPTRLNGGTR